MSVAERYAERLALLVRVLPLLADEEDFALKGGTAINLFHRGMPRLSVDELAGRPLQVVPERPEQRPNRAFVEQNWSTIFRP